MIKKYLKKYLVTILVISCFICTSTLAIAQPSIDNDLQKLNESFKNIQSQLSYISESAFVNSVQNNDTTSLDQSLTVLTNELKNLENDIKDYSNVKDLTRTQTAKLYSLMNSSIFLRLISENLLAYLTTTDPVEQYALLQNTLKLNSAVTLLLNTF
ncbi:MAG: hypothetical protein AB9856_01150 [Cellulosilyticaceae bacterium]